MGCKTQMGMAPTRWPYILEEQIVSRILLVSFFGHKHSIYCSQKNITEREKKLYHFPTVSKLLPINFLLHIVPFSSFCQV